VPSFDPEPRTITEQERLKKIALSENMLISGQLTVSGAPERKPGTVLESQAFFF